MLAANLGTFRVWSALLAACLLAALGLESWRRRDVPSALPLAVGSLLAAAWLLAVAFGAAAVGPEAKIAWHKVKVALQLSVVTATTCFVLEYAHPNRWLIRRNLALIALPPLAGILFIATGGSQLFWRRLELAPTGMVVGYLAAGGSALLAYGLGLIGVNLAVLAWLFVRSPQHRWPATLIMVGGIGTRALYLLNFASVPLPGGVDPDVMAMLFGWMMYAIALYGFRMFDPLPMARRAVIEQMRDGVVVLDTRWRALSLNPAAEAILDIPATRAIGRAAQELLAGFAGLSLDGWADVGASEVSCGQGAKARHYVLNYQPLVDFRGQTVGRLLLIRDVTERRQAEAQLEQLRWTQATIEERELLAQELHDSLSQSLGFLNLQAQTAEIYIQNGQGDAAAASLARLARVSRELQGDVRTLIGDLAAASLPAECFCSTLLQAATRFEEQTHLQVRVEVSEDAAAACVGGGLTDSACVQLLRILQEALANVRKHAGHPRSICVRLTVEGGYLLLQIADDGVGFDPALVDPERHYGLQVMRQRAARIGGEVSIDSRPGGGARVIARAPLTS